MYAIKRFWRTAYADALLALFCACSLVAIGARNQVDPCVTEDDGLFITCVWSAQERSNGQGSSYLAVPPFQVAIPDSFAGWLSK